MKILRTPFFILVTSFFAGCGDLNVVEQVDPDIQLDEDNLAIDEYVETKGYMQVDSTVSGARYTILEIGEGDSIYPNAIVSFNFILRAIEDDLIYQTSIEQLALDEDIFGETRIYTPEICTFTNGTWFVNSLSRVFNTSFVETGYKEGVIAAMQTLRTGGRANILIPSQLAFGGSGLWGLPANSPLAIEIQIVRVR